MEEEKKDDQSEKEKKVFFIQPHDCRLEIAWKIEFTKPDKNTNKEK